jgi:hypothetical protein
MESHRFQATYNAVHRVAFSPDGKLVAGGEGPEETTRQDRPTSGDVGQHSIIHVWETDSGLERCTLPCRDEVLGLAFSPDGEHLWSGSRDGVVTLWDAISGRTIRSFDVGGNGVNSVAFVPSAARCATAGPHRNLKIWDLNTGQEIRSFGSLKEEPLCVALSEKGSELVAGMHNTIMRLWDLTSGHELSSFFTWHDGGLSSVAFSSDGAAALSTAHDQIKSWDLRRTAFFYRLGAAAEQAQVILQNKPHDNVSLRVLAEWYAFRGIWNWSAQLYDEAIAQGALVSSIQLARCYWQAGQIEKAYAAIQEGAQRGEADDYYLRLCLRAITNQLSHSKHLTRDHRPENDSKSGTEATPETKLHSARVIQPGPQNGKDIWTTSAFSFGPGGNRPPKRSLLNPRLGIDSHEPGGGILGGGSNDTDLKVGGWGDWYYSLMQFDLAEQPTNAASAVLYLYCFNLSGGGTPIYLDRITEPWDWRTKGTGRDHDRLWWADKPATSP